MQNLDPSIVNMLQVLEIEQTNQHDHLAPALKTFKGISNFRQLAMKSLKEQAVKNKAAAKLLTLSEEPGWRYSSLTLTDDNGTSKAVENAEQ